MKHKILSVDDEPINQAIVEELLGESFEVALLSSGEECLSDIEKIQPELILMDVSMAGIDGYQTCRELKNRSKTRNIPIIFVSARSTLDDKIKGYNAGGYDYITKPFNHAELEHKIKQTIQSVNTFLSNSTETLSDNTETTEVHSQTSMLDATIIEFLDKTYRCTSLQELGQLLLAHLKEDLQLNCIVQLKNNNSKLNFSSAPQITPLELGLIEDTLNREAFVSFSGHALVNTNNISILLKNFPEDQVEGNSNLKNILRIILNGTESRIQALLQESHLNSLYEGTMEIIQKQVKERTEQSNEQLMTNLRVALKNLFEK